MDSCRVVAPSSTNDACYTRLQTKNKAGPGPGPNPARDTARTPASSARIRSTARGTTSRGTTQIAFLVGVLSHSSDVGVDICTASLRWTERPVGPAAVQSLLSADWSPYLSASNPPSSAAAAAACCHYVWMPHANLSPPMLIDITHTHTHTSTLRWLQYLQPAVSTDISICYYAVDNCRSHEHRAANYFNWTTRGLVNWRMPLLTNSSCK